MEIKTTDKIVRDHSEGRMINMCKKRWVAVDDVIRFINAMKDFGWANKGVRLLEMALNTEKQLSKKKLTKEQKQFLKDSNEVLNAASQSGGK